METGAPSADLLQALRNAGGSPPAVATPANRPYSDPKTVPAEADPVAAAIRSPRRATRSTLARRFPCRAKW